MSQHVLRRATLLAAAAALLSVSGGMAATASTGWSMGGHDFSNTRSNPDQLQINAGNAGKLATKWTFTTHGDVSATPAVVGGAVYFPDWGGYINKVNASTGALIWQRQLSSYGYNTAADLVSRTAPAVVGNVLYIGDQGGGSNIALQPGRVLAINATTGDLMWATAINPNPFTIITQAPVVRNGVVFVGAASAEENAAAFIPGYVCCTFRGSFSALNAATGAILWTTFTVPAANPADAGQYSGGAVWGSTPALDPASNTVYITTGNNYSVPQSAKDCQTNGGTPATCLDPSDHVDSIMALDMTSGAIKWATGVQGFDDWIVSCIPGIAPNPCPTTTPGPDYDFGSGANLFTVKTRGVTRQLVGAGAKSGIYWALDAGTGAIVWSTEAGPGSTLGGIEWGTATDGNRIYIAEANFAHLAYPHNASLPHTGSFAALDPATGAILWQITDPSGGNPLGAVSTSHGVLYAGSMSGHMYAFDAANGNVLRDLVGEGSSNAGPAISNDGVVFWGNGYARFGLGTGSTTFYAFSFKGK
jgi:polyvinyl alcohol dehydrogenase (cytochrome)